MGNRLICIGAVLLTWLAIPAQAFAYNQSITVYATVPPIRAVYLNASGNIIKIAGNTADNIKPTIYDSNNNEVPITPSVQKQYDNFLASHENKLQASKIYNVNPITVSSQANDQSITLAPPASLSLKF